MQETNDHNSDYQSGSSMTVVPAESQKPKNWKKLEKQGCMKWYVKEQLCGPDIAYKIPQQNTMKRKCLKFTCSILLFLLVFFVVFQSSFDKLGTQKAEITSQVPLKNMRVDA